MKVKRFLGKVDYFKNGRKIARFTWNEYHLNDLNAGTPKQTAAIKQWKLINKYDYTAACEYLKSIGLYEDFEIDGLACAGGFPEDVLSGKRGYRYGESRIFRPIPAEIIAEIESW